MNPLSAKRRSELRAEAHKLSPVVIIGDKGLTDEVIAEIDRSLKAHELIKVRAATDERDARAVWIETICDRLQAHAVQQIGKVFVIYRQNPKEEKPKEARPPARARAPREEETRSAPKFEKPPRDRARGRGNDARSTYTKKAGVRTWAKDAQRATWKRPPRSGGTSDETAAPPALKRRARGATVEDEASSEVKRTSRPRSRTPSPLPESGPRRRRPRTSR